MYWYFSWNGGRDILELRGLAREDALKIAQEQGWRPWRWYNPRTWGNFVIEG